MDMKDFIDVARYKSKVCESATMRKEWIYESTGTNERVYILVSWTGRLPTEIIIFYVKSWLRSFHLTWDKRKISGLPSIAAVSDKMKRIS